MKCDRVIDTFLKREVGASIPLRVRLHTLRCVGCRTEIARLRHAYQQMQSRYPFDMLADMTESVMRAIAQHGITEHSVPMSTWIGGGSVIFASIFLLACSDSLRWLLQHFGNDLEIPLSIALGLFITIYAGIFIGAHLDRLKKIFEEHYRQKRAH